MNKFIHLLTIIFYIWKKRNYYGNNKTNPNGENSNRFFYCNGFNLNFIALIMENNIREILIDYHIKTIEFDEVDPEVQRLWAEQHVDEYLKNS